jgi:DNA-binding LytR/AlgR family response regulator
MLFTDIDTPGDMNGSELARMIMKEKPGIRVLLTSGFPDARNRSDAAREVPTARLLGKPYRKCDLARVLREALDG